MHLHMESNKAWRYQISGDVKFKAPQTRCVEPQRRLWGCGGLFSRLLAVIKPVSSVHPLQGRLILMTWHRDLLFWGPRWDERTGGETEPLSPCMSPPPA